MTLSAYLRLLRARWSTVALLTVLGVAVAGVLVLATPPRYEARSQLFVAANTDGGDIAALSQGGAFVQQRVRSYTDLVTSPGVLEPVVATLGLPQTAAELAADVQASSPLDTVLIDITVTAADPRRAADVANEIARRFPETVDRLETAPGRAASPVNVEVTREAVPPRAPAAPRPALLLVLGLLVGLGLGVGAAVLRDGLDRTLPTRAALAELTGLPVLGTVADDARARSSTVLAVDDVSAAAEAYRRLRTNIRYLSVDRSLRSLVVTGSLPGEGKSTTAANLAVALARAGQPVALLDADLRRPSVADLFALPGGIGLTSVLIGDVALTDALQVWRPDLPLRILTAGPLPPNPSELLSSSRMAALVEELTDGGHTVVIDSPPLLPVTDAAILARVTDGALLVVRARSTRSDQVLAAIESLAAAGAPLLGTVLTRTPERISRYAPSGHPSSARAPSGHPSSPAGIPTARHATRSPRAETSLPT